jgi:hypothetical protein
VVAAGTGGEPAPETQVGPVAFVSHKTQEEDGDDLLTIFLDDGIVITMSKELIMSDCSVGIKTRLQSVSSIHFIRLATKPCYGSSVSDAQCPDQEPLPPSWRY